MPSLLPILLSNAAGAALLAALVWPLTLLCRRRPAIGRAVWIVVLLKLLAPPMVAIPLDRWMKHQAPPVVVPQVVLSDAETNWIRANPDLIPRPAVSKAKPRPCRGVARSWLLPTVWVLGTLSFLLVGSAAFLVLMRLLAKAPLACDEVQHLAGSVATRLGIAKPPRVCFVAGVVCPALWAFGRRPRVIIPVSLWDRLDESKRRTLLAHELAHLRRGDHWVRLLEFIAGVIYWWHPAVWMARDKYTILKNSAATPGCCGPCRHPLIATAAHCSKRWISVHLPPDATGLVGRARGVSSSQTETAHDQARNRVAGIVPHQFTCDLRRGRTRPSAGAGAGRERRPRLYPMRGDANVPPSADKAPSAGNPAEIDQARAEVQKLQAEFRRTQANLMQARSRLAVLEHGSAGGGGGFVGGGGGGRRWLWGRIRNRGWGDWIIRRWRWNRNGPRRRWLCGPARTAAHGWNGGDWSAIAWRSRRDGNGDESSAIGWRGWRGAG